MQNNQVENYKLLVDEINNEYVHLQSLSNDDLRSELWAIQHFLIESNNREVALAECLTKVYAIVKETERRFCNGSLVVTANDVDRMWAQQVDFVSIEGGNAIYNNKWLVRDCMYTWNMVPYDEQLLGGIYLHYGYATEMATGEGKTLVATLPVFLNALTHEGVHLMTSNDYLSLRDFEQTRPIYMFYGLSVGVIEQVKNKRRHIEAYENDITFGATSTFIFDYLRDHVTLRSEDCRQRKPFHFVVIDELDFTLIDEAQVPHILGGNSVFDSSNIYLKYKPVIEEFLKDEFLYDVSKGVFTDEGIYWLRNKLNNQELFKYNRLYEVTDQNTLNEDEFNLIKENLEVQHVLRSLFLGYVKYKKDVDYIVDDNKVVIIDSNTGRKREHCRWEHGIHTAIEVKEECKPSHDFDGMAVISVKNFFKLYPKMCGMSGTLWQVKDELKEIYRLETVVLPTHLPIKRVDHSLYVAPDHKEKLRALIDLVKKNHCLGRPLLIGCQSELENAEICSLMKDAGLSFNKLSAKTLEKEAAIIAQAGNSGSITISTSIAGRGTDIKLCPKALEAGGLYVIGTSMFPSVRIDRQLKGRAGRQGDPGDSLFFASPDDEILESLSDNTQAIFKNKVHNHLLNDEEQRQQYFVAQEENELLLAKDRLRAAEKDDMVDTFRKHFYQERNHILMEDAQTEIQYHKFVEDLSVRNKVEAHIHQLYNQIRRITLGISNNEVAGTDVDLFVTPFGIVQTKDDYDEVEIPYSEDKHLFVQTYQRERLLQSEAYFRNQFLKQSMLLVYDQCWTKFVKHILDDLDQHEIKLLPSEYEHIYQDMSHIIVTRLLNTIIPVGGTQDVDIDDIKDSSKVPNDHKTTTPEANELCPCGSGKKYCECHGRSIRNKKKRRR